MTHTKNGKQAPFQIGQKVRHLSAAADQSARTVLWVSKGATCRADQVIATDYDPNNTVQSDVYVGAA